MDRPANDLVDTLSASAGEGMLVYLATKKKSGGASLAQTTEYIEGLKKYVCHWFVVDDLDYLKKGGRISSTAAFVGKMLGIKPILHVTEEGKPVNVTTVRGTKAAIRLFAEKYAARKLELGTRVHFPRRQSIRSRVVGKGNEAPVRRRCGAGHLHWHGSRLSHRPRRHRILLFG